MKPEKISRHADLRMNQRGINSLMVELVYTFGKSTYQKGGTEKLAIPKKLVKQLRQAVDHVDNVSVVTDKESNLITVMHDH